MEAETEINYSGKSDNDRRIISGNNNNMINANRLKIAVASEHAGFALKTALLPLLAQAGWEALDMGVHSDAPSDYPEIACELAAAVLDKRCAKGILLCGTGIGMCVAANKIAGIRAALCGDVFSARMSRLHNDANILCMGAWLTAPRLAMEISAVFLNTEFEGGRHIPRLKKLSLLERRANVAGEDHA